MIAARCATELPTKKWPNPYDTKWNLLFSNFMASLPDGALIGTGVFSTSSQFALSAVPPPFWKLFIIAHWCQRRPLENSFSVLLPLTLRPSVPVWGFSDSRMVFVTLSQFLRACGRVGPAFVAGGEELRKKTNWRRELA